MEKVKLEISTDLCGKVIRILNSYSRFMSTKNEDYHNERIDELIKYISDERKKTVDKNLEYRKQRDEIFSHLLEKYTLEEIKKL